MKRAPRDQELRLTHITTMNGDTAVFALSDENYHPYVIETVMDMLEHGTTVVGFRLTRNGNSFVTSTEHGPITKNIVTWDEAGNITLSTTLLAGGIGGPPDMIQAVADVEQCAAIALYQLTKQEGK